MGELAAAKYRDGTSPCHGSHHERLSGLATPWWLTAEVTMAMRVGRSAAGPVPGQRFADVGHQVTHQQFPRADRPRRRRQQRTLRLDGGELAARLSTARGTCCRPLSFHTSCDVFAGQGVLAAAGVSAVAGRDVVRVADAMDAGGCGSARQQATAAQVNKLWGQSERTPGGSGGRRRRATCVSAARIEDARARLKRLVETRLAGRAEAGQVHAASPLSVLGAPGGIPEHAQPSM